ncbi:hypothetical protein Dimus_012626 [Dionaea muscipula]
MNMEGLCELCSGQARMYCESDQASLCWDCDDKVHGANFLVAKHTRTVLCHVCQSHTPWKAAGRNLGRTVSICEGCVGKSNAGAMRKEVVDDKVRGSGGDHEETAQIRRAALNSHRHEVDDEFDDEDEGVDEDAEVEDDGYDSCSDCEDLEDEDDENQVVPLTSTPPPPAAAVSSSSEEDEPSFGGRRSRGSLKRVREFAFLHSDEEAMKRRRTGWRGG